MGDDRDRDDGGTFSPAFDQPEDLLDVLEAGERYRSSEVADEAGIALRTAQKYLKQLAEQGDVEAIDVHARLTLFEIPEQ